MRLRRLLAVGLLVHGSAACTRAQESRVLARLHCRDDQLWNGRDGDCQSPTQFCKRTFGRDAHPAEDKNGDIGCYKVK